MTIDDFDVEAFLAQAIEQSCAQPIRAPGIYAILLASPDLLAPITPGQAGVLYVGMTDATLEARNHFLHAHSGFSTLRRSLGALLKDTLGLIAIPRGPGSSKTNFLNYRYLEAGERELSQWMNHHLLISQIAVCGNLAGLEQELIAHLEPPLNLTGWPNPQRPLLKAMRAACTAEARGARA